MEARALTRHEKASLKSFLSGVYAGLIPLAVSRICDSPRKIKHNRDETHRIKPLLQSVHIISCGVISLHCQDDDCLAQVLRNESRLCHLLHLYLRIQLGTDITICCVFASNWIQTFSFVVSSLPTGYTHHRILYLRESWVQSISSNPTGYQQQPGLYYATDFETSIKYLHQHQSFALSLIHCCFPRALAR